MDQETVQNLILRKYEGVVRDAGERKKMIHPFNANFLVVLPVGSDSVRVIPLGFRGPIDLAKKKLDKMRKKRGIPNVVSINDYALLVIVPNPLPTRIEDLEQIQA